MPEESHEPIIGITEADLAPKPEPVIRIEESDFVQPPPDIVINYRDVARNPFEWIGGAVKDLRERVKVMSKNVGWWGGGQRGKEKASSYEQVEKERSDVENLIEQIVILPDESQQSWRSTTDKDLGDIEIKFIEDAIGVKPGEDIVITEADLNAPQEQLSSAERERRNREFWDNHTREQQEFFQTQTAVIDRLYSGRQLQTPIRMDRHHRQQYAGQNGIYTCAVASTLNSLYALRAARPDDNEDSLIQAVGGRSVFMEHGGYLPMGRVFDLLQDRGLAVRDSGNMLELLQTLENGGVAIIAYGGHARMISGAETRDNQVQLRVHDPFSTEVSFVPTNDLMRRINQTRSFYNMFLVEKPVQTPNK